MLKINKEDLEDGKWYFLNNCFTAWWDSHNESFEESYEGDGDSWGYEYVKEIGEIND